MAVVEKEIIAKNYYNNYKNNLFFQWSDGDPLAPCEPPHHERLILLSVSRKSDD